MFYYWRRAIIGDCAYIRDNTVVCLAKAWFINTWHMAHGSKAKDHERMQSRYQLFPMLLHLHTILSVSPPAQYLCQQKNKCNISDVWVSAAVSQGPALQCVQGKNVRCHSVLCILYHRHRHGHGFRSMWQGRDRDRGRGGGRVSLSLALPPHPLLVRLGGYDVETLGRRSSLNLTTTATIQVVRASPSCISCLALSGLCKKKKKKKKGAGAGVGAGVGAGQGRGRGVGRCFRVVRCAT